MTTTVVLIEDHVAYRESFRLALSASGDFTVVGEAGRARDAYPLIERTKPDLAVIDFLLPDSNGVSLARELKRRRLRSKTLVLGRQTHPLFVRDAMQSGIGGFALKQEPLETVMDAMRRVAAGEFYMSPLLEKQQQADEASGLNDSALGKLSAREREVLFLLIDGLSSKEIANALFLSSKTVDAHRLHINRKLGVRTPAALVRAVADKGLIAV
jgi:DNA-binding NarL/FixJ family response regulator